MKKFFSKRLVIHIASFLFIFSISILSNILIVKAQTDDNLSTRLSGRILLQVEDNGEAWYINPLDDLRSYLGRPNDAFSIMREEGVGITNDNLQKIPVSLDYLSGTDSDSDGLPDDLETAIGTNPESNDTDNDGYDDYTEIESNYSPTGDAVKRQSIDMAFAKLQAGKIFLQVESNGEAWYISPDNYNRYYLGRPSDAFSLMRNLGLGISNINLEEIIIREEKGIQEYNYSNQETNKEVQEVNKISVSTNPVDLMRDFTKILEVTATINNSTGYDFKEKGFLLDYTMIQEDFLIPTLDSYKTKIIDTSIGFSIKANIDNLLSKEFPYVRPYVIESNDQVIYGETMPIDSVGSRGTPKLPNPGRLLSHDNIELIDFNLIYSAEENGSIEQNNVQEIKEGNDSYSVYAKPDLCYEFDKWSDGVTDNPRVDTNINSNINVTAIFKSKGLFCIGLENFSGEYLSPTVISSEITFWDTYYGGYNFNGYPLLPEYYEGLTIDWGDGVSNDLSDGLYFWDPSYFPDFDGVWRYRAFSHNYQEKGNYEIIISGPLYKVNGLEIYEHDKLTLPDDLTYLYRLEFDYYFEEYYNNNNFNLNLSTLNNLRQLYIYPGSFKINELNISNNIYIEELIDYTCSNLKIILDESSNYDYLYYLDLSCWDDSIENSTIEYTSSFVNLISNNFKTFGSQYINLYLYNKSLSSSDVDLFLFKLLELIETEELQTMIDLSLNGPSNAPPTEAGLNAYNSIIDYVNNNPDFDHPEWFDLEIN